MNEKMIEAIRREAFTQGYICGRTDGVQSNLTDSEILEMLPAVDDAYTKYRAERSPTK